MRTSLRIVVAAAFAAAYGIFGFGAAGFGEGWVSAARVGLPGCVFLAFAVNNGLRQFPSRRSAILHLLLAVGSTVALYIDTQLQGVQSFHRALLHVPEAVAGFLVGLAAFYAFPTLALLRHARSHPDSSGLPHTEGEARRRP
jgi:hypothetical protein